MNDRRTPATALGGRVSERFDQRMAGEDAADDLTLDADAAAVDQPHFSEPARHRFREVLLDDGGDVARSERVKIERVLDRNVNGVVFAQRRGPAVTCCCQCSKLRRSSPESLHCQKVAARSKKGTSTRATRSARAVSATFCVTI